ncbi:glucose 1-dehydrogenase [Bordetella ansorpii]|uniref:Glucose 1-dehydrogenase n=1 Tax=Bordetella ansorpii TaxID=288768 RepID=A0A157S5U2_9BORD|nr:glucose 1-dehydrogenase [Bordetella ansorpii]SAI65772.1 glucose 1-dehydrogenase [Bordetella ansorpii]
MSQTQELAGRVALVTGATSGIGRAVAISLAGAGARVAVNYRDAKDGRQRADEVVAEIVGAGGQAVPVLGDVSREDEVGQMFAEVRSQLGELDILVNNAGIEQPAPIQDMTLAQWQAVIDVNLTGQFLCARAAARAYLARWPEPPPKGASAGKILFISSVHEVIPWAFQANYAASKGGVSLLMRSLAQELAPRKIRVNSIAPGAIRTPINHAAWGTSQAMAELLKLIPYDRIGEPEDIGRAAVWLASDASDYVTGATLFVDGGMTLYPEFRGAG